MKYISSIKHLFPFLLLALLLSTLDLRSLITVNALVTVPLSTTGINATVDANGAYTINSKTLAWTFAGNVGHTLSDITYNAGIDSIGSYKEITFNYQAATPRSGSIRAYDNAPLVLFTDTYLSTSLNNAPFPKLTNYPKNLHHLSYTGQFAHANFNALADDSPWLFFDDQQDAFLLSPASDFMIASTTQNKDGSILSGINSAVSTLPAGFTHKTLLAITQGINNVYDLWGHALTDLHGKTRPANDADITLNELGYWTDTGGAYYYNFDHALGYTGTLLAVRDSFRKQGIPLGYMELDSWFYPKGTSQTWMGDPNNDRGGIYLYYATPALFPNGLKAFQQQLGLPLVTHARWIDPTSPYRKLYSMSNNVSTDPQYWNQIASYLKDSGVVAYKQDWLNDRALPAINLNDPNAFMNNMASAMAANGIAIQYCLPLARHFLQSSLYNNVLTMRVSPDHFARSDWDWFLYTSRLAAAVGIWPYTDVFNSTETDNLLLSTLSAGIVGIGDPIGAESKTNLFQSIRTDGVIVKPDVPIVPLDQMYALDAQNQNAPMIASTYTDHGAMKAVYVFAYKRGTNTAISFNPSSLGLTGSVYVYNFFTHTGQVVAAGSNYNDTVNDASYYIVVPIGPSGIAFLGDPGKFVSLGQKRISQLTDNGTLQATISFSRGERYVPLTGYSLAPPVVTASKGAVSLLTYDISTHLFRFVVTPSADQSATIRITQPPF
jgi:hypothetical protein